MSAHPSFIRSTASRKAHETKFAGKESSSCKACKQAAAGVASPTPWAHCDMPGSQSDHNRKARGVYIVWHITAGPPGFHQLVLQDGLPRLEAALMRRLPDGRGSGLGLGDVMSSLTPARLLRNSNPPSPAPWVKREVCGLAGAARGPERRRRAPRGWSPWGHLCLCVLVACVFGLACVAKPQEKRHK
jgi:hypothetical protein